MNIAYPIRFTILFFGLAAIYNIVFAQTELRRITYPYGGEKDSSRRVRSSIPLNFEKPVDFAFTRFETSANFQYAHFMENAIFRNSRFAVRTSFNVAKFKEKADFHRAQFDTSAIFNIVKFARDADFTEARFADFVDFGSGQFGGNASFRLALFVRGVSFNNQVSFASIADFTGAHFGSRTFFAKVNFGGNTFFGGAKFDADADFEGAQCDSNMYFSFYDDDRVSFSGNASFRNANFRSNAFFPEVHFGGVADFRGARFDKDADFHGAVWDSSLDFSSARFGDYFSIRESTLKRRPEFEATVFKGRVDLGATRFTEGVDLRRANLDSVSTVYFDDHTYYPDGKLQVRWDQIKGRLHLLVVDTIHWGPALSGDSVSVLESRRWEKMSHSEKEEQYRRLEISYHKLRDNYLAQRDNESADYVMYELSGHRTDMLNEFLWQCYGWFFGWGYQPWRFLLLIVLPLVVAFAVVWYWFYYEQVLRVVDEKVEQKINPNGLFRVNLGEREIRLFRFPRIHIPGVRLRLYNHTNQPRAGNQPYLGRLTRYWHVIFFSASVLLGIRFKKEWIYVNDQIGKLGHKSFVRIVTFEWLLGIGLYIVFALLVKGSRFEFIKALLGF